MKMGDIASVEEEDDPDDIPEGFHLQEESPHCINMKRAYDYQAYLRQIVLDFERLIKSGATNISEEYAKVIQSMFWAVKANKQTILNGADPAEVLASIPDARCKAWRLKLNGKMTVDPVTLVDDTEIGPQMASDVMNLKCTVSLSVFAGPERILRRFYVFAEEPRKSTITTSEPCSPVFKEAQPRPSEAVNQFN